MSLTDADRADLATARHGRLALTDEQIAAVEAIVARRVAAAVQATTERVEAECARWDNAPVQTPKAVVMGVRAALAGSTDPTPDTRTKVEAWHVCAPECES